MIGKTISHYKVIGDLLYGSGQRIVREEKQNPEPIQIALNDIIQIQYEAEDDSGNKKYLENKIACYERSDGFAGFIIL